MSIDDIVTYIQQNKNLDSNKTKNLDWRKVETALCITSSKELAEVLSHEDELTPAYEMKEHHIKPNSWYSEDADTHTQNDKPLTKKQLMKRIKKVYA